MEPLVISIAQASSMLGGTSRSTIYRLIATGALKKVKFGRRTYISMESLKQAAVDGFAAA